MDICNIFYMSLQETTATRSGSLIRTSSFKKLLKLPIWGSGESVCVCVCVCVCVRERERERESFTVWLAC